MISSLIDEDIRGDPWTLRGWARMRILQKDRLCKVIERIVLFVVVLVLGCTASPRIKETKTIERGRDKAEAGLKTGEPGDRRFVLGEGDEVRVTVWKHDDLTRVLRIDSSGKLFYPLVGEIDTAGLSAADLREIITEGLSGYIMNPQVNVEIQAFRSQKIYVLGEVRQPGVLTLDDSMNIMEGLLLAGGFTRDADEKKVILVRPHPEEIELHAVNVMDLLRKGDRNQIVMLQKDDIVYVPPSFIANVDRFFEHVDNIFRPIIGVERSIILGDEIWRIIVGKPPRGAVIIR